MDFLDGLLHYNDPSLPKLSSLSYLFAAILLSSFAISFDVGKVFGRRKRVTMASGPPEFTSVNGLALKESPNTRQYT
jgi:hypothetical protein